jgi:DNA-directed RNA polymerase sigma subunit (sigma70/sigma32)
VTTREVAKALGLSPARVGQIEHSALAKLRRWMALPEKSRRELIARRRAEKA